MTPLNWYTSSSIINICSQFCYYVTSSDGVFGWMWTRQEITGFGMQWHQPDHMQTICTSLQTDNHTNTPSLNFLQALKPVAWPQYSVYNCCDGVGLCEMVKLNICWRASEGPNHKQWNFIWRRHLGYQLTQLSTKYTQHIFIKCFQKGVCK